LLEHLKTKSPSYGHLRLLVQAAAFAAVLALIPHAAVARTLRLVALGDSLTAGYGLSPGKAFPDRLEAALRAKGWDVKVINAGVSGDTAADALARYDWSVPRDADALLVELGGNDMLRGMKPEATKTTLAAILDKARGAHLPVLLAGMRAAPNLGGEYAGEFAAIYSALAKSYNVPLYPFFLDGVAGDPKLDQPDGLHPNPDGVEIIVRKILPSVEALLKQVNR
jgi:acyl-CoA thioesterase I